MRTAFETPECRNGDARVGTPRLDALSFLAVSMQRTDFDMHPIAELWEVLAVRCVLPERSR